MRIIIVININHRSTENGQAKHNFPGSLHSDALFVLWDEVLIQHHDEQYSLRRTINYKLILTK